MAKTQKSNLAIHVNNKYIYVYIPIYNIIDNLIPNKPIKIEKIFVLVLLKLIYNELLN